MLRTVKWCTNCGGPVLIDSTETTYKEDIKCMHTERCEHAPLVDVQDQLPPRLQNYRAPRPFTEAERKMEYVYSQSGGAHLLHRIRY